MAVFQVLAKVVCTEELLSLVALAKLVHVIQMLGPRIPVCRIREVVATVAAHIGQGGTDR